MLYYKTDDNKGKVAGIVAGVGYVLLWVVLMLFYSFSYERPDDGGGILIDFGDTESASGMMDPDVNDVTEPVPPDFSSPDQSDTEYITQDFEEAPEITQPEVRQQDHSQQTQPETRPTERPPQDQPREVNRNALFPGRTENSTSQSEGSAATGAGNQGVQDGSPQGSHEGTGGGGSGAGFSLAGRTVVGSLAQPPQARNKQGRVIVDITVDPAGNVVRAVYRASGSTTNDAELVKAAETAALKSKFNKIESDQNQVGTITYNFRLN